MHDVKPNLIIGFHGCDRQVRDTLLMNPNDFRISQQPHDWLGYGMYFWEDNHDRALEWATEKQQRGQISEPAVIGAVLSLGYCCNLLDKRYIRFLVYHFKYMKEQYEMLGKELPQNNDLQHDKYKDKKLRHRDCRHLRKNPHPNLYPQPQLHQRLLPPPPRNRIHPLARKHQKYVASCITVIELFLRRSLVH